MFEFLKLWDFLRMVPTFITAHRFCASQILGFPMCGAY